MIHIILRLQVIRYFAVQQGIPENAIIEEDRSETTHENMIFSREKIQEINRREAEESRQIRKVEEEQFFSGDTVEPIGDEAEVIDADEAVETPQEEPDETPGGNSDEDTDK